MEEEKFYAVFKIEKNKKYFVSFLDEMNEIEKNYVINKQNFYMKNLEDIDDYERFLIDDSSGRDDGFIYDILHDKILVNKKEFFDKQYNGKCIMPKVEFIDLKAFFNSNFSGTLYIPRCSYISNAAFYNSNFNKIIIGENAFLDFYCVGAHSEEFIRDYQANKKLSGRYIFDGEQWIYKP